MEFWNDIKTATWAQRFVWANVALFLTCALVVEDAANAAMFFLFVTGVVSLFRQGLPQDISRGEKWLLAAFAVYFLVGVVSYNLGIRTRLGWEIIFRDIRFLFAIPAYIALRRYPPPAWLVWLTVAIGAFLLMLFGLIEYLTSGSGWRIGGATISIVFGHLAVSIVLVSTAGVASLRKLSCRLFLFSAAIAAAVAVILSGTRGAWVAMFIAEGVLLIYSCWTIDFRKRLALVIGVIVITIFTGSIFYGKVIGRISVVFKETKMYLSNYNFVSNMPDFSEIGCVNDRDLLARLGAQRLERGEGELSFSIVSDDHLAASHIGAGCSTSFVVRVENVSNQLAWFYTAPRSVTPQSVCRASLLVRGQGSFQIAGGREFRKSVDTEKYRELTLQCDQTKWPRVAGILDPGEVLYYAPVARYPGEYHYFYANTSVGARYAMWGAAWVIFLQHPVLGVGTGAYSSYVAQLVLAGKVPGVAAWFDHAHSEYLTVLADRGLLGLAGLLLLYGVPIWIFWSLFRKGQGLDRNPAAAAGLMMVGGFMISGLTETLFNHSIAITYYSLFISILVVLARQQAETGEDDHARKL